MIIITKQKLKDIGEIAFYTLAIIGIIDMFMYSVTQGEIRLIRGFLSIFFGINE